MESERLRQFLAVVEAGSISRAAQAVNVSQPALSKNVRRLEESLGAPLLRRSAQGVVPTEVGEILAEHARVILGEIRNLNYILEERRGTASGSVTIGVSPSVVINVLPEAIDRVQNRFPLARFNIFETFEAERVGAWTSGVDISVGAFHDHPGGTRIVRIPLYHERIVVASGSKHPLRGKARSLSELLDQEWILIAGPTSFDQKFVESFERHKLVPPKVTIRTTSTNFILSRLQHSDALSLVGFSLVEDAIKEGRLALLDVKGLQWHRRIDVTYRSDVRISAIAKEIIVELKRASRRKQKSMALGSA